MASCQTSTLFIDIGDVLCDWTPPRNFSIDPKLFSELRNSQTWYEYNCGHISEDECFSRLAKEYDVSHADLKSAISAARDSQHQNDEVVAAIKDLKIRRSDMCVYAISNISKPDFEILRSKPFHWDLFDGIFTSWECGMCKPELRFYRHVLGSTKTRAKDAIFIDDKLSNVIAAQSSGFKEAILFDDIYNVKRKLLNIIENPVLRGKNWLRANAMQYYSETQSGIKIADNFSQLLILEVTADR